MSQLNPATPAQAATPGSQEPNVITPPSTTTPPAGGQGPEGEVGKITLTPKEFTDLNRDAARFRASVKRGEVKKGAPAPTGDPTTDDLIADANKRAEIAEKEALKTQVQVGVRDLLDKDQFKAIPKSTRELILKSPHLLSQADNLEEAMFDIEDFLIETIASETVPPSTTTDKKSPDGVVTPPTVNAGGSAPAGNSNFEDTSKLSGPAKSQAMIRNQMRGQKK